MFLAKSYCDFRYIEKHFSVCRDEKVIDDVRNRVAAYEDSIRHHHEMVEMATYKISKIITPEFSTTASFSVFWN